MNAADPELSEKVNMEQSQIQDKVGSKNNAEATKQVVNVQMMCLLKI